MLEAAGPLSDRARASLDEMKRLFQGAERRAVKRADAPAPARKAAARKTAAGKTAARPAGRKAAAPRKGRTA